MKLKKYLCLTAAVTISFCAVVLSRNYHILDAITRPSDSTASIMFKGIDSFRVDMVVRPSKVFSNYEIPSEKLTSIILKQLKEAGVVVKARPKADAQILVEIQTKTREGTDFVAVNISVSLIEGVPLERIHPKLYEVSGIGIYGTTWQSRMTLLVHKSEISEEVPKCLRLLVGHFCKVFLRSRNCF
ncbi:MAG: hypothetical protein GWN00_33015 [Aliifodinibius sp.]|nr:hypothetical protein [Phycisphaerae bacterium]NIT60857.1 hypothetical protein [Fodinibius sp.]NIW39796.1 hypothetical protein [candidate division Zixibacteria bacterium]NIW98011.1 hypothetical protein [Phycisphaerae bacterium]NIY29438.1 hypothetical protein [Fodinibius sp.]